MIQILASLLCLAANYLFLYDLYLAESLITFLSITTFLFSSFLLFSLMGLIIPNLLTALVFHSYLILASLINYFKFYYKIIISPTLIQSILNTDVRETIELFNLSLLIWVLLTGILPSIVYYFVGNIYNTYRNKPSYILITSCLVGGIAFSVISLSPNIHTTRRLTNSICSFMPYNYILSLKNYLFLSRSSYLAENINNIFNFSMSEEDKKDLNVILVIGESARADRWGINGYSRDTTPKLSKIDGLISYKDTYSLATNTPSGVENIMKKSGNDQLSSFIQIFNQLKFETHWYSNQGAKYKSINAIALEANKRMFSDDLRTSKTGNNYDIDLIPFVKEALLTNQSSMIVLHTIGSHRLYDLRYPNEFKVFTPTCVNNELFYSVNECSDVEKLGNSYDNSILYTDYFLAELIEILKDSNAIIIFISDHGESLGENGVYAHAHPVEIAPKEQTHVPLILWASKSFLAKTSNLRRFNKAAEKKDLRIDQSYIFHSILDCIGVKSDAIDYSKSLCH